VRVASRLYVDGKGLEQVWRDSFSEAVALRRMGHLKMADAELITNAALLTQAFQAMAAEAAVWFPAISSQSDALSTSSTTSMINDQSPENAICSRVKAAIARALRILRPPEQKKEGHGPVSARRWERNRDRVKIVTHVPEDQARHFPTLNGADHHPKKTKENNTGTDIPPPSSPPPQARSAEVELTESLWQLEPVVFHSNRAGNTAFVGSWATTTELPKAPAPPQQRGVGVLSADAPAWVAPTAPSAVDVAQNNAAAPSAALDVFHFYQLVDGQRAFLHPLNIRMLKEHFGSYEAFPHTLTARLLQADTEILADGSVASTLDGQDGGGGGGGIVSGVYDNQKRLRYLSHLPLGCSITLCEVDLRGIVSKKVSAKYQADLRRRNQARQSRVRRDNKHSKTAQMRAQKRQAQQQQRSNQSPGLTSRTWDGGPKSPTLNDAESFPSMEASPLLNAQGKGGQGAGLPPSAMSLLPPPPPPPPPLSSSSVWGHGAPSADVLSLGASAKQSLWRSEACLRSRSDPRWLDTMEKSRTGFAFNKEGDAVVVRSANKLNLRSLLSSSANGAAAAAAAAEEGGGGAQQAETSKTKKRTDKKKKKRSRGVLLFATGGGARR
jgi:hypothetical protein